MLTSFHLQVVVAVVRQQVAAVARQQVVVERVVVVQRAFALLQAVPLAFAGKIRQTELCLPLQVAITFSFHLPPNEFCF